MVARDQQTLNNDVDFCLDEIKKITNEVKPLLQAQQRALAKLSGAAPDAHTRSLTKQLGELGEKQKVIQDALVTTQAQLDNIKLGLADNPRINPFEEGEGKVWRSVKEAFEATKGFETFRARVLDRSETTGNSGKIEVGLFARPFVDYIPGAPNQLASPRKDLSRSLLEAFVRRSTTLNTNDTAQIVTPRFMEEILLRPRPVSLARQLCPAVRVELNGVGTNKVTMYRESERATPGATLTSEITGGVSTSATISNVVGLKGDTDEGEDAYPFSAIEIVDRTADPVLREDVTVLTVVLATNTITFAAPTGSFPVGSEVRFKAVTETPEGLIKPSILSRLEPYEVTIPTIALTQKLTNQLLRNVRGSQDYVETMGSQLLAEMEEWNGWYGRGPITGWFRDPAIQALAEQEAFPDWSEMPAGTTIFDYLVYGFYQLAKRNVIARQIVMSVERHRDLSLSKGSDLRYIWNMDKPAGAPEMAFVGEILWSPYLRESDIMMGDFALASRFLDSFQARSDFGLSGDDFERNEITARFEVDETLATPLPNYLLPLVADAAPEPEAVI